MTRPEIRHEKGRIDDKQVTIVFDESADEWRPNLKELFQMLDLWFEAENHLHGEGYGRDWVKFFIDLLFLGYTDEAKEGAELSGWRAKEHFKEMVKEHGNEVIKSTSELIERCKKE